MIKSNFDKTLVKINGHHCHAGWDAIVTELLTASGSAAGNKTIVVECYHGVYAEEILARLGRLLNPSLVIETKAALLEEASIAAMVQVCNRRSGIRILPHLSSKIILMQQNLLRCNKRSAMLKRELFWSLERAHRCCVQIRHCLFMQTCRDGKYSYVLEKEQHQQPWPNKQQCNIRLSIQACFTLLTGVFATVKEKTIQSLELYSGCNKEGSPKMIDATAFKAVMQVAVSRPFRVVPFFDPGPWGGQWLKEVCDLDRTQQNFAWGFDCVPRKQYPPFFRQRGNGNTLTKYCFSSNLKICWAKAVVKKVSVTNSPIRFDFLDTMEGGNLSLQVHPLKEYIREKFGMSYTQDESYYFMDAKKKHLYISAKENIVPETMLNEL